MLIGILALLAAASVPAVAPTTVSPLTVTSPSLSRPPPADVELQMEGSADGADPLVTIWPADAYQAGVDGHVSLRCLVDVHGLAEHCEVAYESPAGKGFGHAALEMQPTIKITPTAGPDGPVSALKIIAITFKAPYRLGRGAEVYEAIKSNDYTLLRFGKQNGLSLHKAITLDEPVWAAAPTFDDLAAAYPAKGGGEEGYAVARCRVRRAGVLEGCQVIKETPERKGFGMAAVHLATAKFKVARQFAVAPPRVLLLVNVPIRFTPPAVLADRTVTAPVWLAGLDPKAVPKVFPPAAAASGVTSGKGVARCIVAPDGSMTQCAPEAGEPAGLGFSETAATLAAKMRMNLWSADAAPVAGGVVHIPIRLNLKRPAT